MPLIEVSKLLGSVIGVLLLLLANALRQRLDAAYLGTLALLVLGAVLSLLKGLNWEEATLLVVMALVLLPCRSFFHRRSSLLGQSLSLGWWLAVAAVGVGAYVSLDLAYRNVEYSNDLWWRFEPGAQAPRSFRAMLTAAVAFLIVGALRLLRPVPPTPEPATPEALDRAQAITAASSRTTGYLALLGDKTLLFHDDGRAFLMYGVSGRTWVAMGDPVGPPDHQEELAWRFRELADRHGARAVFYEVSEQALPVYLELGLDLRKLGEEGRVPLPDFTLEGSTRKGLRQTRSRLTREGASFEIVPASQVPPLLDEFEAISNAWLASKNTREKRFSLGYFDREYLARLPAAVVRQEGRVVAFANVWPSDSKLDLSIDMMRYGPSAPSGVMEYLFLEMILYGKAEGYQCYSLGMAPLSGFEHRAPGSLVEPLRRPALPPRRALLQLPGPARVQGQVRPGVGVALPRGAGRAHHPVGPHAHRSARVGRRRRRRREVAPRYSASARISSAICAGDSMGRKWLRSARWISRPLRSSFTSPGQVGDDEKSIRSRSRGGNLARRISTGSSRARMLPCTPGLVRLVM